MRANDASALAKAPMRHCVPAGYSPRLPGLIGSVLRLVMAETKHITLRLPSKTAADLDAIVAEHGGDRSRKVRRYIRDGIRRDKERNPKGD